MRWDVWPTFCLPCLASLKSDRTIGLMFLSLKQDLINEKDCHKRTTCKLTKLQEMISGNFRALKSSLTMPQKKWTKRIHRSIWKSFMISSQRSSTERSVRSTLISMSTVSHFLKWLRSTASFSASRSYSPCFRRLVNRRSFHYNLKMALQWLCVEKLC